MLETEKAIASVNIHAVTLVQLLNQWSYHCSTSVQERATELRMCTNMCINQKIFEHNQHVFKKFLSSAA